MEYRLCLWRLRNELYFMYWNLLLSQGKQTEIAKTDVEQVLVFLKGFKKGYLTAGVEEKKEKEKDVRRIGKRTWKARKNRGEAKGWSHCFLGINGVAVI